LSELDDDVDEPPVLEFPELALPEFPVAEFPLPEFPLPELPLPESELAGFAALASAAGAGDAVPFVGEEDDVSRDSPPLPFFG